MPDENLIFIKINNSVRRKGDSLDNRIIVPVYIYGDKHMALVDTGASHSFIDTKIVSQYNIAVIEATGHVELADKSTIMRIGETENVGGSVLSAPYEVIEQKYAILIGMDHFYRFGFRIEGLPDVEESTHRVPEP
ncbi:hypothetical protein BC939DRAFT_468500 [Gamsiella multidivaricata]|uniref:uncharacterized protein n=1 Tax=Gamsiella multidivaricata TaxID=101098 RepID=UPI002221234D|nr:uncharacterized protein BC939DRAFT_468500 [Gamsiella multidivaricata]KAI7816635.1 hypothetical protein BC939DRAFT_468500 [Gamsiella multidivaricata]